MPADGGRDAPGVTGAPEAGVPATVLGHLGRRALAGDARVGVEADAVRVTLAPPAAPAAPASPASPALPAVGDVIRVELGALDGVRYADGALTLFVAGGDVVELRGAPRLAAAAREIVHRASALDEVTLRLRAFGSHRGAAAAHDRFFAPLLAARKRAERAADLDARLAAFDGAALRGAFEGLARELAAERCPSSRPDCRALEAHLVDAVEPLLARLADLAAAARGVRESADEHRLARVREWRGAVHAAFAAADRAWLAAREVLERWTPSPPRRWWRRARR